MRRLSRLQFARPTKLACAETGWEATGATHDKSGHTWHHSSKVLFDYTKLGPKALIGRDYQTDMPGYKDILLDAEIIAVLSYIKSTWPENIRRRHDAIDKKQNHKH